MLCHDNKVRKFIVQSQLVFNKLDKGGAEIVPLLTNFKHFKARKL
ncbi:MAG: Uncharacterised protein [Cryomorphaceae bacterium]|nr:MAG: Uncharacterised protein [Cryomorphaceae bacterium]